MKKIRKIVLFLIITAIFLLLKQNTVYAEGCTISPDYINLVTDKNVTFSVTSNYEIDSSYKIYLFCAEPYGWSADPVIINNTTKVDEKKFNFTFDTATKTLLINGTTFISKKDRCLDTWTDEKPKLVIKDFNENEICASNEITVVNENTESLCQVTVDPDIPQPGSNNQYTLNFTDLKYDEDASMKLWRFDGHASEIPNAISVTKIAEIGKQDKYSKTFNSESQGQVISYYITGKYQDIDRNQMNPMCVIEIIIGQGSNPYNDPVLDPTKICDFASDNERSNCEICIKLPGVWTPFGCIETNMQLFVEKILKIAIGLGGGIAFLMVVYGGFMVMLSSGNPEKLNAGKEIITSAIAGLLLIVFSVVILKIIGVDIFNIPGLGGTLKK